MSKKVSVVMAAYNPGRFIEPAIESLLQQTYENIEVIIINDGSTDDTAERVKPYLSDSRVRYFEQDNAGQTIAKNNGIKKATGELIGFLDADDFFALNKLELQVPLFDTDPKIGVVYSNTSGIDEHGQLIFSRANSFKCYSGDVTEQLFYRNFVPFSTALVRKEALDRAGLFDESIAMGIDWELWLRLSMEYQFYHIDESLLFYRQWEGQMSHKWKERYEWAEHIMNQFLERYPDALTDKAIDAAWADTYTARGNLYLLEDKNKTAAREDFRRALDHQWHFVPTWKSIIKMYLPWLRRRTAQRA
jgi:glycosyltransferase involved in cell wall biosynthesis